MRCNICAGGGDNVVLNCGYGRGYSVLEVIETVKRVSGVNFEVRMAARRAGDPAELVAEPRLIARPCLGPQFDDLELIVEHALNWERKLAGMIGRRRSGRLVRRLRRAIPYPARKCFSTYFSPSGGGGNV